jgi:hypothetical protein
MRPPAEATSSERPEVRITTDGDDAAKHSGGRGLCPNRMMATDKGDARSPD